MYRENQYTYIVSTSTTGSTATILAGKGFLHSIVKNNASGDVIRICDATSGTTANIGIIASGSAAGTYLYDVIVSRGLIVDTGISTDITVTWSKP